MESRWTTVDQLEKVGYEEYLIDSQPHYKNSKNMNQFLAGADTPISAGNIEFWGYAHHRVWAGANFQNQLDWVDGVIIADTNISPSYADPEANVYPPITQWSDVVFISWITHAPTAAAIQGLKRVVRAAVANDDTKAQIQRAFVASGSATVPVWPGHRFETNPFTFIGPSTGLMATPFMAMLGSKNGAGVAYLLATHRATLGLKCINAIRVWAETEWSTSGAVTEENLLNFVPSMAFEIVDTPTGP
ncbi:hypothetical protein EAF04_007678 [Stromatinia cepivora]|nr:hypothetical protein EAF04_007678 [Stromatinia cepivora]